MSLVVVLQWSHCSHEGGKGNEVSVQTNKAVTPIRWLMETSWSNIEGCETQIFDGLYGSGHVSHV